MIHIFKIARTKIDAKKLLTILLVCFLVYLVLHSFLVALIGKLTGSYAFIKVGKDIIIFVCFFAVLVTRLRKERYRRWLVTDWTSRLIWMYALLHIVLMIALSLTNDKSAIAGIIFNLRFLLLFQTVRMLLLGSGAYVAILTKVLAHTLVVVGVVVAIAAILQVSVISRDFLAHYGYDGIRAPSAYSLVDDRPDAPRAFATLRGPNELGAYLILPICIAATGALMDRRRSQKLVLAGCVAIMCIAVIATYSRSALLGVGVAFLIGAIYRYRQHIKRKHIGIGIGIFLACALAAFISAVFVPSIRVAVFHSSDTDTSLIEGSTADHLTATTEGLKDVLTNPMGHGPGGAGPAAFYESNSEARIAENYFVQIAQEVGVVGLFLFILIYYRVASRLMSTPWSAVGLALFSSLAGISLTAMLLHTWTDESIAYTWWMLAAVYISGLSSDASQDHIKRALTGK